MSAVQLNQTQDIQQEKAPICDRVPKGSVVARPETSQEHALERLRGWSAPAQDRPASIQVEQLREKTTQKHASPPPRWSAKPEKNTTVAFFVGVIYSFAFTCISPFSGQGVWPWVRMVILVCLSAVVAFFVVKNVGQPTWLSGLLTVLLVFLSGFVYNVVTFSLEVFDFFKRKMIENGKRYME